MVKREGLKAEVREFTIRHPYGGERYQTFKAEQNEQCRKLHVERLVNLQQGNFSLKCLLYVKSGLIAKHAELF